MIPNEKRPLRVLVACEYSGVVRDAFAKFPGVEAWSCDLLPSESPGLHYQGPVEDLLEGWMPSGQGSEFENERKALIKRRGQSFFRPLSLPRWDVSINHPPCTYLCSSGLHWNKRRAGRAIQTELALEFVRLLLGAPIRYKVLENPVGCISTRIRPPDQTIQPWQFGHPESKATCLWLEGLERIKPTQVLSKPACGYWDNQTPSGQNKLGPGQDRWKIRSRTYQGIADALAQQIIDQIASRPENPIVKP